MIRSGHGMARCVRDGVLAGLAGALPLWAILAVSRGFSPLGDVVGRPSPLAGFAVAVAMAAAAGVVYSLAIRARVATPGAHTLTGVLFGLSVWAALVYGVLPAVEGDTLRFPWAFRDLGEALPTLAGHALFGGLLGRTFDFLQCRGCVE